MSGKKARQNRQQPVNEPNNCIFCGKAGNMTKQHVWPDQMENVYPRDNEKHIIENRGLKFDNGFPEYYQNGKENNGHQGTKKVRMLCGTCNRGWMRDIENAMMPILSPLLMIIL